MHHLSNFGHFAGHGNGGILLVGLFLVLVLAAVKS